MASTRPLARLAFLSSEEKSAPFGGSNSPKMTNLPALIFSSNGMMSTSRMMAKEKQTIQAFYSNHLNFAIF
jgi:hypothetical protein